MKRADLMGVGVVSWVVVYIAANRTTAEMLRDRLRQEGLLATIRPAGGIKAATDGGFEVLVPSSEAQDASDLLNRVVGR